VQNDQQFDSSMDLQLARQLAIDLIEAHGLAPRWKFAFDHAIRRFGNCDYTHRRITLSAPLTQLNDEAMVKDTILHEIANALAPKGVGHGPAWKAIAESIGCTPLRCYGNEVRMPGQKFVGVCPTCATTISRSRRKRLSCGKCDRKFNPRHLFVWSKAAESDRSRQRKSEQ
jgi:predicted SprT family Zn-dependent metalloprotease